MSIIQQNTPLEKYNINGRDIFVKREDLSSLDPAPRLSKLRGVYERMLKVKNEGYKTIGVFDTRVSKAGWGCAAIAQEIGDLEIINFYPELKEYLKTNFIPENQRKVKELGGKLCGMKGGRTAVLYSQSKKLAEMKGWYMMPLGLVVEESVKATSKIAETLPANALGGDLVVCIGSGMITAGIASALATKLNRIYAVSAGMDNTRQRLRIKKVI
jgi:threonine dehydratase